MGLGSRLTARQGRPAPSRVAPLRTTGHHMSVFRKLLFSLMIVGTVGSTVGAGTFASFNASTTNQTTTFQTGTIILGQSAKANATSNDPNTETICLSTGRTDTYANVVGTPGGTLVGGLNSKDCGQFFNVTLQKPASDLPLPTDSALDINVQNFGNLNATLSVSGLPACSDNHGGNLCNALELQVQEYSDRARTTPNTCHYGGGTATVCDWAANKTIGLFDNQLNTLGPLDKFGGDPATLNATDIRYFRLRVRLMPVADLETVNADINDFQERNASVGLAWTLTSS